MVPEEAAAKWNQVHHTKLSHTSAVPYASSKFLIPTKESLLNKVLGPYSACNLAKDESPMGFSQRSLEKMCWKPILWNKY